jgi:hypothetical protein
VISAAMCSSLQELSRWEINVEWQDIPSHAGSPVASKFTRFLYKNYIYFTLYRIKLQKWKILTNISAAWDRVTTVKWIKAK